MISIVIPTLQKRADLLENLVKILNSDPKVGEIIIIDNSTKGINFSYNKLKVIVPKENCFVNPSWNLGIKEAQFIYRAFERRYNYPRKPLQRYFMRNGKNR